MSFNGSGVFNINTAGQPVVTGTTISSTTFNNLTADLATGLTTTLTKDGQSTPTANIGLGTYKITNLGAGTVASDAARLDQVQGGAATFITVTGTDTLTGTVSPALSAYATGNQFSFLVANTNTGAVTINVDGIGSKAITRTGTTALVAGDMVAGQAVEIIYDGTRFQLVNGNSFTNLKVSGTLGVTGIATFTSQPIVSSLTASLPVFTDASKGLVSNTMTGTGSVAMSASPTFTGTVGAVDITTTGNTILGNASTDTLNVGNGGLVKDASGQLHLGNTVPTDGHTSSSQFFVGLTGNVFSQRTAALGISGTSLFENQYIKESTGNYAYITTGPASKITLQENTITFSNSASGTAGNAVTNTERMRIDSSGNLLLGSTSATGTGALRGSYGTGGITTNFAAGDGALNANTTGIQNTAVGYTSLNTNTTGNNNQAFGYQTLFSNLSGSSNTAMGLAALYWNTASNNTAVGFQAMSGASGTSTGTGNAALGYQALYSNTSGNYNSAFGTSAQKLNTTGVSNVALGVNSLYSNLTGSYNTAVGLESLFYNTTSNNTAVGYSAMAAVTTGSGNTAVGYLAGVNLTTGVNNIYLGTNAGASSAAVAQELHITTSTGGVGKGTNTGYINVNGGGVYQGNNSAAWSITSDQRLKKNIVDNTTGLDAINAIQVRNFEYRLPEEVTELEAHSAIDIKGVQLGAIAQELQLILPECVKTESTGVMSVDSSNLTWYLVNAVKELTARVKQLEGK